jgi:hypothetical protein
MPIPALGPLPTDRRHTWSRKKIMKLTTLALSLWPLFTGTAIITVALVAVVRFLFRRGKGLLDI